MKINDSHLSQKVQIELVSLLYKNFHLVLIGESLGAMLYAVILWGNIDHTIVMIWLACNIFINGIARHLITIFYHRATPLITRKQAVTWSTIIIATGFLAGIVWGVGACFINWVPNDVGRLVVVLFMMAVMGAANAKFISSKLAYFSFVLPIYLPLVISLVAFNTPIFNIVAIGVTISVLFSAKIAFNSATDLKASLALQFRNATLLELITNSKQALEKSNQKLIKEIKARRDAEKSLHDLATHDPLTGLPNRILFSDKLNQAFLRAERFNTMVALLFIDLDYFKSVNDSLGHDVGDKLLMDVSVRLLNSIRHVDNIARLGGDEFCVLLEDIKDVKEVPKIAEKLRKSFQKPFLINDHEINITISIGISIYPNDCNDVSSLFKTADIALYQAKKNGRNNCRFFAQAEKPYTE